MKPKEIFSRLHELVMNYNAEGQAENYILET